MRKLLQSFNDLKIRNKFLIVYLLSVLLPIIATNSAFYIMTNNRFVEQKEIDIELVLNQTQQDFRYLTDQAVGLATTLYLDVRLYDFFDRDYLSPIEYIEAYNQVLRQYNTSTPLYNTIQSLNFYTENPTILLSGGVAALTDDVQSNEWYEGMKEAGQPHAFINLETDNDINLSIYTELDYFYLYDQYEKVVQIDMNPIALKQAFNNVTLQGDLYLIDQDETIIYTNNNQVDWVGDRVDFDEEAFPDHYIVIKNVLHDRYFEDWQIVAVVDSSEFTSELIESSQFIIMLSIINFILPTLIIVFISKSFHSRLDKILHHMKNIEKQNFEEYPYIKSKDEIGQLTRQINRMTRRINKLFNEVFRTNIEKKDLEIKEKQAQLSALQSQINPHFLFNSLETIRMRSLIKGETETANIIENMAGIFRNSLTWGRDWVTVKEEVHLIKAFLEIQAYRFGDKLAYSVELEPEIGSVKIPNLSFLPFVENASLHGIEPLKDQGTIHISIYREDTFIIFKITDNGVGIPPDRLALIEDQLENEQDMGENVGIQNVYYRLKFYYKDTFKFNISTEVNEGTTVNIHLPVESN
ncbi:sensor histidine kinase [Amphibacillus sp. Q70]|uniref:sensor histidine kinase n=1 Tax=Amphibacillus sp. Q70 TaxID=3453416 RepID=UPI003F84050D